MLGQSELFCILINLPQPNLTYIWSEILDMIYLNRISLRKRLCAGPVPANKKHLTGTVPVNKEQLTGTLYIFWGTDGEILIAIS